VECEDGAAGPRALLTLNRLPAGQDLQVLQSVLSIKMNPNPNLNPNPKESKRFA